MKHHRLLSIALFALAVSACHGRPTIEKAEPERAGAGHPVDAATIAAPGVVEPWSGELRLAALEEGVLAELLVSEGQAVEAGALLARLEDSRQRHEVAIAQADVREATALLGGTSSTPEERRLAEAEYRAASARAEQRERERERAQSLDAAGVIARAEAERSVSSSQVDQAALDSAAAKLQTVKRGARSSEREALRARLEAAGARLLAARAALTRRELRATQDAVVLWSRFHAGEFYTPAQGPLLVLGDLRRLQVRLEVDELDAAAFLPGARCELRADDGRSLGQGSLVRVAAEYGTRSLVPERPTPRSDARVRELFVAVEGPTSLAPGQRLWGYLERGPLHAAR